MEHHSTSLALMNIAQIRQSNMLITEQIRQEMLYELPRQDAEKFWRGEVCGRCGDKSRAYEGGKCACDYEIKELKAQWMKMLDALLDQVTTDEMKQVAATQAAAYPAYQPPVNTN